MSALDKKLYQLIISRLNGYEIASPSYREGLFELVRKGIGGFIIFGGKKDEVKELVLQLQSASETTLFIASDIERGAGQQIEGGSHVPSQMAVAAALTNKEGEDFRLLMSGILSLAAEAADIGINMPLLPVLDVNLDPENPIICTRAFSDKPGDVAWYGSMYIKLLEGSGLLSCAKHFPGHGDTSVDSHISLPIISKTKEELMKTDIFPFKEAVRIGVSCIMAGHLSVPAIDDVPTTVSAHMVELLRNELGYEGLIMTDAMNMDALNEIDGAAVKSLKAGYDIILHPADADATVDELKQAVSSGIIKESIIDTAAGRIAAYKARINYQRSEPDYKANAELFEVISDRAVTLVKDTSGVFPITDLPSVPLVYTFDENRHDPSVLNAAFQEAFAVNEYNGEGRTVVIALFTSIAAWAGSSGIRDDEIGTIREIIQRSHASIVISFGSPYVLKHFQEADSLIAAYDTSAQAQASVIRCLRGERVFRGRLPVEL